MINKFIYHDFNSELSESQSKFYQSTVLSQSEIYCTVKLSEYLFNRKLYFVNDEKLNLNSERITDIHISVKQEIFSSNKNQIFTL